VIKVLFCFFKCQTFLRCSLGLSNAMQGCLRDFLLGCDGSLILGEWRHPKGGPELTKTINAALTHESPSWPRGSVAD